MQSQVPYKSSSFKVSIGGIIDEIEINKKRRPVLTSQQQKATTTDTKVPIKPPNRQPIRRRIEQTRADKERLRQDNNQQENWRPIANKRANRITSTNRQRLLNTSSKRRNQAGHLQG